MSENKNKTYSSDILVNNNGPDESHQLPVPKLPE